MPKISLQNQILTLEKRVHRLEHVFEAKEKEPQTWGEKLHHFFALEDGQGVNRTLGWGILTLSGLGLLSNLHNQSVLFLLVISASVGLWLIIQASGIIDESDTVRALAQEQRAHTAGKAGALHLTSQVEKRSKTAWPWLLVAAGIFLAITVLTYLLTTSTVDFQLETLFIFCLFVWGAFEVVRRNASLSLQYLFIAGCYVMLAVMPTLSDAFILTMLFTALVYWWTEQKQEGRLQTLSLAAALYLTQIWLVPDLSQVTPLGEVMRFLFGIILSGLLLLPYTFRRRTLEDRDDARLTIMIGAAGLLSTLLTSSLRDYAAGWTISLAATMLVLAGLAYFAWQKFGRFSYAKYLLTLALFAALACFYLSFDDATVTLLLFMSGVVLLGVGFTLPSYSTRLVGLATLGLGTLNYLLVVMPATDTMAAPILLREHVWIGLLLALFLPALSHWYELARLRGTERILVPSVMQSCYTVSFLILFGIIFTDFGGTFQALLWILLSLFAVVMGYLHRLLLLRILGAGLGITASIVFILVDLPTLSILLQLLLLLLFGAVLVALGVNGMKFRRVS